MALNLSKLPPQKKKHRNRLAPNRLGSQVALLGELQSAGQPAQKERHWRSRQEIREHGRAIRQAREHARFLGNQGAASGRLFRITLSYQNTQDSPGGKTSEDTDTFQVKFVELIPHERIVEVIVFESQDPRFAGEIRMIVTFWDADGGTEVTLLCENCQKAFGPKTTNWAVTNLSESWPRSSSDHRDPKRYALTITPQEL